MSLLCPRLTRNIQEWHHLMLFFCTYSLLAAYLIYAGHILLV